MISHALLKRFQPPTVSQTKRLMREREGTNASIFLHLARISKVNLQRIAKSALCAGQGPLGRSVRRTAVQFAAIKRLAGAWQKKGQRKRKGNDWEITVLLYLILISLYLVCLAKSKYGTATTNLHVSFAFMYTELRLIHSW